MTDGGEPRRLSRVKLVILGRDNCGKTAFCVRFITRRYIGEYDREREVTYKCRKIVDKEAVDLEILDTVNKNSGPAGSTLESSIKWGDGFVIMYSVTDRCSFEFVSCLKRLIDRIKQSLGTPTVIVANKSDVGNGRVVQTEEGEALASQLRCHFHELSVAEGWVAVEAAVSQLVLDVRLELHRQLLATDRRSRVLQMGHTLRNKLIRSKTMQW